MTRRELALDSLVASGFVALGVAITFSVEASTGARATAVALVVAHVAPLVARRRHPAGVLATMVATGLLAPVLGAPVVVLGPAALVAVYTVGALVPPQRSMALATVAALGMAVAVVASGMDPDTVVTNALAFAVAWWLGDRSRRSVALAEAERGAAADLAARAVADERLRIARELHDIVAHAMSVIAVQAGSGRLVMDQSPDVARHALATIETTSRDALQEMRRLLAVLRDDAPGDSTRAPAPGVADLDDLIAGTAQHGVVVGLRTDGDPVDLPAGAGLCVYRVVQEALTNVRKHAQASRADVTVRYAVDALELEVVDDGIGCRSEETGGHGLLGLRERVELYGGSFTAGPLDRGFRVSARIPLAGQP